MPVDKIVVRKQPGKKLYKAYTVVPGREPPMRALSEMGLSKKMADKQKTAVQLNSAGRLPARVPKKSKKM